MGAELAGIPRSRLPSHGRDSSAMLAAHLRTAMKAADRAAELIRRGRGRKGALHWKGPRGFPVELAAVACGTFDAAVLCANRPWDVLPGSFP